MAHCIIIGGGLSGLSLAWYIKKLSGNKQFDVTVLESENRVGGKAWTEKKDGFVIERGVNGVLDNKPSTIGLAKELGLELLKSNDESRIRFVVRDGRLERLPDSPGTFFKSPILSLSGKLRLLKEPFVPKAPEDLDESLASFAIRRLGEEAYKYLIDPMASGIFAGNPERLSLRSCFPRIHELEQRYGSLIKAMFSLMVEARKKGRKKKASAGPGGVLTSFVGGMEELVQALKARLSDNLHLNSKAVALWRENDAWKVATEDSKVYEGTHVILALPAYCAKDLVMNLSAELARLFSFFEYPPIAVCAFGFRNSAVADLKGFGFLAPHCEKRAILGCLWDSSVFKHRAKKGYHLVRCLMGGMRNRHILEKSNDYLLERAFYEMKDLMNVKMEPEFTECFRWERAIPQYHVGHQGLLNEISNILRDYPGLFIRCNWIGGVSLNDCIANSMNLAQKIVAGEENTRF